MFGNLTELPGGGGIYSEHFASVMEAKVGLTHGQNPSKLAQCPGFGP